MMRLFLSLALAFLIPVISTAQPVDYSVGSIPATLKENANAVLRSDSLIVDIQSPDKVIITKKVVVTVLNKDGDEYAMVKESYDEFSEISVFHATLYDSNGYEIKKIRKKDIHDYGVSSVRDITNDRYRWLTFTPDRYPYTCEYEVKIESTSTFQLPEWFPQPGNDCAVEYAEVLVRYSKDVPLRFRAFNYNKDVKLIQQDDKKVVTASVRNIPAKTNENTDIFAAEDKSLTMIFASDKFMLGDSAGSMATWKDLGRFIYDLNANRDTLPQNIKTLVHQLTDTCKNAPQKIAILYEYLQKNTRYVSILLGIGGWQTFDANFVATKGYGDCKALSNYMHSLLKEAGIASYQVLVHSGSNTQAKLIEDFPESRFNHVILCVPNNRDTVWLECTSPYLPANYLSNFTASRKALLLGPDGGTIVQTPSYSKTENFLGRKAEIRLDAKGQLTGQLSQYMNGSFWDAEISEIKEMSKTETDQHFNELFRTGTYVTNSHNVADYSKLGTPTLKEDIDFTGSGMVTFSQQHVFINPHLLGTYVWWPQSFEKRRTSFKIPHPYQVSDSITMNLPEGSYVFESQNQADMQTNFGGFHYGATLKGSQLIITTNYDFTDGVYPAEQFVDYIKLAKLSKSSLANQIVLKKL